MFSPFAYPFHEDYIKPMEEWHASMGSLGCATLIGSISANMQAFGPSLLSTQESRVRTGWTRIQFGTLDCRNDEFSKAFRDTGEIFPSWLLKPAGRLLPWKKLNDLMDLAEVLNSSARKIYEAKKKLLEQGDGATVKQIEGGKDILSVLIQANTKAAEEDRLSEEEVLAQMTDEITEACKDNDELSHDELVSLSYLDAVCRETLRLYAPAPGVLRTTRGNALLPLSTPIHDNDGREIRELFIPDNTDIYIHIHNLNRDPLIWGPDAAEWKPERWLSPLPESVAEAKIQGVYSNTMTFIGGPRSCIGFKFSQLEMSK
ncbi:cytochrome P450 [Gloeopeniophorella convolvens]|nr:cytochrome P450 [Gloeopeniophorella convolvens]